MDKEEIREQLSRVARNLEKVYQQSKVVSDAIGNRDDCNDLYYDSLVLRVSVGSAIEKILKDAPSFSMDMGGRDA